MSSISPYNIAGLISDVSEAATQIAKNCRHQHPTLIWCPHQEERPRMCTCTLYFQKN